MKKLILKYHRSLIWTLLIFQLFLFIANIPGLSMHIDEAWFGEQAYYLAENGYAKSEMFQDFLSYDERIMVYHKVFIWAGAGMIKSFGLNLYGLRMISLLFGLILAGLLYRFCKRYYNFTIFKLALLILLFNPLIFRNSSLYRPEIMITVFGFLSFFFLYEFLRNRRILFLILSALVAGFSLLVHLNGIIFIGAGAFLLLYNKQWRYFVIFSTIAGLVASIYFYETIGNFGLFSLQFLNDPSNAGGNAQWYMPFKNLINEHKRLFRKPEIFGLTILFLLTAYYWIKNKTKDKRVMLVYTFCLVILMGIINHNKTTKYGILLFPFFAVMIAEYIYILIHDNSKIKGVIQKLFVAILSMTILFGIYTSFKLILFGKENWADNNQAVVSHIPKNSKLLAPMKFIFSEIDNYHIFGFLPARIILEKRGNDFTAKNISQICNEYDVEYIIINEHYRQELECTSGDTTCLEYGQFKYFTSESEYDIYKRE